MEKTFVVYHYQTPEGKRPVHEFLFSLDHNEREKMFRLITYLAEYGLFGVKNHCRKLTGTLFWELRVLGKHNLRVIFIPIPNDSFLLLHGFAKKTQKTPIKEIETVLTRYQNYLNSLAS